MKIENLLDRIEEDREESKLIDKMRLKLEDALESLDWCISTDQSQELGILPQKETQGTKKLIQYLMRDVLRHYNYKVVQIRTREDDLKILQQGEPEIEPEPEPDFEETEEEYIEPEEPIDDGELEIEI